MTTIVCTAKQIKITVPSGRYFCWSRMVGSDGTDTLAGIGGEKRARYYMDCQTAGVALRQLIDSLKTWGVSV